MYTLYKSENVIYAFFILLHVPISFQHLNQNKILILICGIKFTHLHNLILTAKYISYSYFVLEIKLLDLTFRKVILILF